MLICKRQKCCLGMYISINGTETDAIANQLRNQKGVEITVVVNRIGGASTFPIIKLLVDLIEGGSKRSRSITGKQWVGDGCLLRWWRGRTGGRVGMYLTGGSMISNTSIVDGKGNSTVDVMKLPVELQGSNCAFQFNKVISNR